MLLQHARPWIGHRSVTQDEAGADGTWGVLPLYGPPPRPEGYVDLPRPEEIADAHVQTDWTCPYCGADNDVWGEGAVFSWMECMSCFKFAFLVM